MRNNLLTLAALAVCSPSFMLAGDTGGPAAGSAALNTFGLPPWQSHKTVWASKIVSIAELNDDQHTIQCEAGQPLTVFNSWLDKNKAQVGGYFVLYQDGYRSYSPAEAFEEGYTPQVGEHPGEIGWLAWVKTLEGHPAAEGAPTWQTMLTTEGGIFARAWNRAARAIESKVRAGLLKLASIIPTDALTDNFTTAQALEFAWGIIANASGGDWSKEGADWVAAASEFRDKVYAPSIGTGTPAPAAALADLPRPGDAGEKVMRAKLRVGGVTPPISNGDVNQSLEMYPVGPSQYPADGSDENNSFARWSPSGHLALVVANPALFNRINVGDEFYVDFTRAIPAVTPAVPAVVAKDPAVIDPHEAPPQPEVSNVTAEPVPDPKPAELPPPAAEPTGNVAAGEATAAAAGSASEIAAAAATGAAS